MMSYILYLTHLISGEILFSNRKPCNHIIIPKYYIIVVFHVFVSLDKYDVNNKTKSTTKYVYFNNTQVPLLWLMQTEKTILQF